VACLRGPIGLLAVLVGLLVVTGAGAARRPAPGEKSALAAVRQAVKSGRLDRATADAARAEIVRAGNLVRVLPPGRRLHVEVALREVGELAGRLTRPRARAVFGQLRANDEYFARHRAPKGGTDITDSDGVVYRYFVGRCFEFHPLANFSALNAHIAAKDAAATKLLADELVARGVSRRGGGIGWEYYFGFGGGRPPWVSGMAQAVAAQAFARAAQLVPDESVVLLREAKAAYRAIAGRLTTKTAAGPWIRLYSFRTVQVLNAQLQSVLSLESYARDAGDSAAAVFAAQMEHAAAAALPRFDTGYWTYYSLAGVPSRLSYHQYVVRLLRKLAPEDARFGRAATRFAAYLRQPPAFKLATSSSGRLRFWLSKPAVVSIETAAGQKRHLSLGGGWHTLRWREPERAGIYGVKVSAVGPAGNRASFAALPLVRVTAAAHRLPSGGGRSGRSGSATATPPVLAAGAGIDGAAQAPLAEPVGLGLVRITVPWQPGETAADRGVVASLQSIPSGLGLVVELSTSGLPVDDRDRSALDSFAASLAQAPALRDLFLAPAPSLATAPAYADALASIRLAVDKVRSDIAVGPSVDGSARPQRTTLALAKELAHDGSAADVVALRPAAETGSGKWAAGDVGRLESALEKWLRAPSPVFLDALGTATTVPQSELSAYAGGAPPTDGAVTPAAQASLYADAIETASCSRDVTGLLFDRLVDDGAAPEPATGLYYASGDQKPSGAAVKGAIAAAARGAVVCPGIDARVTPTTLMFPQRLGTGSAPSLSLGCSRDCLYLVTLDRADGRPVLVRRGGLTGGRAPQTIVLPRHKLPAGRYRLDVRLVSRVNPGQLTRRVSPFLAAG
jgi:hypothetical protein